MTEFKETELDERAIKMAKVLSADAVENAGSGHPGSPVSLAPIAYTLYQLFIKHDPNDPNWEGRDRFILSGGHASLTQYVQLYFSGYGLTLDDLKHFRGGADTRTPGHPEYGLTPGIEMTTGPLGQGFASAIGFAYGERFQRGLLDPETPKEDSPFYHKIWAICGEGDIEEGISGEAASLAANQKLGNITVIFDANRIQIEGDTNLVLAEDVLKRFQAYGWYTDEFSFIQPDGSYKEDVEGLADVIAKAEAAAPDQPKLIKVDTLIAWPTPGKTNDPSSHGSKLGAEAVAGLKKILGYDPEESFHVDEEALAHARKVAERGLEAHKEWDEKFDAWRKANPDKAALYDRLKAGELPEGFDKAIDDLEATFEVGKSVATRGASGSVLNAIAAVMPELWGGSADLGGSNKTDLKGAATFAPEECATKQWPVCNEFGRQLHFGVREFAMGCITNGILLGSHTRPFGGTFFMFSDYERSAVRLAAHAAWDEKYEAWRKANPDKAALYDRLKAGELPEGFDKALDDLEATFEVGKNVATRGASGSVLNAIAAVMPELWGGSADLGGSNKTDLKGAATFAPEGNETKQWPVVSPFGRQLHFGVREFTMGTITNGILLGSHTRPFGGTFFMFSDYERPAVRLAALMEIPNLFVWTHDSVAVGEDGPTHQPIEHLAAFRAMPQLEVVRPADAFETAEAYRYFFEKKNTLPAAMVLTRQGVPVLAETAAKAKDGVKRGAYVLVDTEGTPDVLLLASGSEVQLAVSAAKTLAGEGVKARVVSVPSLEWFEEQDEDYKESVLPAAVKARVSVEAGVAMPWYKYLGSYGKPVSIEQFGLQGSGSQNLIDLGITAEHVVDAAKASIAEVQAA